MEWELKQILNKQLGQIQKSVDSKISQVDRIRLVENNFVND